MPKQEATQTHCSECVRGGNGDKSCSSGWNVTNRRGSNAYRMCFSGKKLNTIRDKPETTRPVVVSFHGSIRLRVDAKNRDDAEAKARKVFRDLADRLNPSGRDRIFRAIDLDDAVFAVPQTEEERKTMLSKIKPKKSVQPGDPPPRALLENEVYVVCYGAGEIRDRNEAIKFFEQGMMECEGPESRRYMTIANLLRNYPDHDCVDDQGHVWRADGK